jgi:formamidopyrimidine-DNA glycosylase
MPELPEVETVRRALAGTVVGRTIRDVRRSRHRLRDDGRRSLVTRLRGRTITGLRRHGKFLLIDLDADLTLLSHLGMSGRWLFEREPPGERLDHVHVVLEFTDGTALRFQDPRRFGMARVVERPRLARDRSLAGLGPDPIADPPTGHRLFTLSRGARVSIKNFLLDQRRIAGIGNIYASEILFRARVDPRRRAGVVRAHEWDAIAAQTIQVLDEAIARMGTTFSMYRTLWGEPGGYGERLRVYDRAGKPCPNCGTPIRQIVQGARSTYYCPVCQPRSGRPRGEAEAPARPTRATSREPRRARRAAPSGPRHPRKRHRKSAP